MDDGRLSPVAHGRAVIPSEVERPLFFFLKRNESQAYDRPPPSQPLARHPEAHRGILVRIHLTISATTLPHEAEPGCCLCGSPPQAPMLLVRRPPLATSDRPVAANASCTFWALSRVFSRRSTGWLKRRRPRQRRAMRPSPMRETWTASSGGWRNSLLGAPNE